MRPRDWTPADTFGLTCFRFSELQTYPVALGFLMAMDAEDGDELLWEMHCICNAAMLNHPGISGEVTEQPLKALEAHYFVLHGRFADCDTIPF
jgi:hypothetical protein